MFSVTKLKNNGISGSKEVPCTVCEHATFSPICTVQ